MKHADYRCHDCNKITDYWMKSKIDDFPENVECEHCNSLNTQKIITGNPIADVAEGRCGNSKSNYEKSPVYHPSRFGKFKGKRIK